MKPKRPLWDGVEKMSAAKTERRRQLAKLPFEEKISILLRLQAMAREMSKASGRECREVWRCEE